MENEEKCDLEVLQSKIEELKKKKKRYVKLFLVGYLITLLPLFASIFYVQIGEKVIDPVKEHNEIKMEVFELKNLNEGLEKHIGKALEKYPDLELSKNYLLLMEQIDSSISLLEHERSVLENESRRYQTFQKVREIMYCVVYVCLFIGLSIAGIYAFKHMSAVSNIRETRAKISKLIVDKTKLLQTHS